MNKERIIEELSLRPFGAKGWWSSESIHCPNCGKGDKFGILFTQQGGVTHCFYECGKNISLFKLLVSIDRKDLIGSIYIKQKLKQSLPSIYEEETETEEAEQIKIRLPIGSKQIQQDAYLDDRNFLPQHYSQFKPSITKIDLSYRDYYIFSIFMNNQLKGYLSRSKRSKEWHKENLKQHKKDKSVRLVLRYKNSSGTIFEELLGGYDEITEKTETIIIVEGLFDKTGTDKKLDLYKDETIRCVFTFGNSISVGQIQLLRKKKSVKNIIIMYDPETIQQVKSTALIMMKYFNVKVAELSGELDPGDATEKEIKRAINNLISPIDYYSKRLVLNLG